MSYFVVFLLLINLYILNLFDFMKEGGKNEIDQGESVQQTSDVGFIITGETLSDGLDRYNVWLIKIDSEGNLLCDKAFDVNGHDFVYSVQQTNDGGYLIAGFIKNLLLKDEGFLIKTDSNGEKEWIKTYDYKRRGGIIHAVQQTSDEGYILTGNVPYSPLFTDVWLIITDSNGDVPMGRTRNLTKSRLFKLFPNLFKIFKKIINITIKKISICKKLILYLYWSILVEHPIRKAFLIISEILIVSMQKSCISFP